jgi:hypothetical protein
VVEARFLHHAVGPGGNWHIRYDTHKNKKARGLAPGF